MNKIKNFSYLGFIAIFITAFISCDNTLNLVESGADVPIVYALLSSTNEEQFVRVERGFIDPIKSAEEIALIEDSVYYKNAQVSLINLRTSSSFVLSKVNAKDLGYTREEGFFPTDPNYIYFHDGAATDFLPGDDVRLELKRDEVSDIVFSEIKLLDTLLIATPKANAATSFPDKGKYKVQWADNSDTPATFYSINFIINYEEADLTDAEPEFEPKRIVWKYADVQETFVAEITGSDFYRFLGNNLEKDDKYVRTFEYMDMEITYSGNEMQKYLNFLNANTGITSSQPIPPYSNLSDGLGLVAEKNKQYVRNILLKQVALDSLADGRFTKGLGF